MLNARSVVNKLDILKIMVQAYDYPDIIAISETWSDSSMTDAELSIPNYALFRTDRPTRGGGVALHINHNLHPVPAAHVNTYGYREITSCVIPLRNNDKLLVVMCYRPESNTPVDNTALYSFLESLSATTFSHVIVMGDFNYKDIDWRNFQWPPSCDSFMQAILTAGLHQHVLSPTRHANILDLVLTNEEHMASDISINSGLGRSDHFSVAFRLDCYTDPTTDTAHPKRNFRLANWPKIKDHVALLTPADYDDTTHTLWSQIRNVITSAINDHVPFFRPRVQRTKPVWADAVVMRTLSTQTTKLRSYQRSGLYQDLRQYQASSELVHTETIRAKRAFERQLAFNIKDDTKSFWSYVKSKQATRPQVGPILAPDGSHVSDDPGMAGLLSDFFASVYTREDPVVPIFARRGRASIESVHFTEDSVKRQLLRVKRHAAAGPDEIPNELLFNCADPMSSILTSLFNLSMQRSEVPTDWLKANVTAIFKKGTRSSCENYRPISLSPSICKVMESIVAEALMTFAVTNKVLYPSQFGFVKGKSCELQLLDYLDWVTQVVNQGDSVDVVYLDLRKAFDRVPHRRLLCKLEGYGISGKLLQWIAAFLHNRSQRVVVNGTASPWKEVASGVPQGSVLGPLLFLFFINDIDECASSRVLKFADDTKVFRRLHTSNATNQPRLLVELDICDIQLDIDALAAWADVWQMEFNVAKCVCLHFGHRNPRHSYSLNGSEIPSAHSEKDLGVHISDDLKCSTHCAETVSMVEKVLWLIRRHFVYLNKSTFLPLYFALIRSRLEYASCAWCPHYKRDIKLIEDVQRRATKLVPDARNMPYEDRLRFLQIQTLETRRLRADMITMYRMAHGAVNVPLSRFFDLAPDTRLRGHPYKLRAKTSPKLNCARFAFAYRTVDSWNSLPLHVVTAPSVESFKRSLHVSGWLPEL